MFRSFKPKPATFSGHIIVVLILLGTLLVGCADEVGMQPDTDGNTGAVSIPEEVNRFNTLERQNFDNNNTSNDITEIYTEKDGTWIQEN